MRGLAAIIYGTTGIGKTSFAMEFEALGPVTFLSVKESGYEDIAQYRPPIKGIEHHDIESYSEIISVATKVESGTLVLDSLSGLQQMLFDYVCKTIYNGKWDGVKGEKFFTNFYQGQRVDSPKVLEELLIVLDNLIRKGVHVLLLAHSDIDDEPNATGADYKKFVIHLDKGIGKVLEKWAAHIFFMNIDVNVNIAEESDGGKTTLGKAVDIDKRLMYVTQSPGHQAKNRELFPATKPIIQMGDSSKTAFTNFYKALPPLFRTAWPLKQSS